MPLFITADDRGEIKKFGAEISYMQYTVIPTEMKRALLAADEAFSAHIARQFRRGSRTPGIKWENLRPMTMHLRTLRSGTKLPKGISAKAAGKLWYRKRAHSIANPDSNEGFGWTKVAQQAALAPGKVTGRGQLKVLTRDFNSKGKAAKQRLVWWHFGTRTKVTPKMRGFLHRVGVHLKKTTTELKREPRPIYREGEAEKMARDAIEKRVNAVAAALEAVGLTGVRIVRR